VTYPLAMSLQPTKRLQLIQDHLFPHRTLEDVARLALLYFGHFSAEQQKMGQPNAFAPPQPLVQQFPYGYDHSYTTHPVRVLLQLQTLQ